MRLSKGSPIFFYQCFLGLAIITISCAVPITSQPPRCCFAKQHSAKRVLSSQTTSPDGTKDISKVLIDFHIERKKSCFLFDFHRWSMIMHMIKIANWLEWEALQKYLRLAFYQRIRWIIILMKKWPIHFFLIRVNVKYQPHLSRITAFRVSSSKSLSLQLNVLICLSLRRLESAVYINSSNYEFNGRQMLADTWFDEVDGFSIYQTHSRDKCIPLKFEYSSTDPGRNS